MKTLADRSKAVAYINSMMKGRAIVDFNYFFSMRGHMEFQINPSWFPDINVFNYVRYCLTKALGFKELYPTPSTAKWYLTPERSIQLETETNGWLTITLFDEATA